MALSEKKEGSVPLPERMGAAGWALLAWMLGRDLCSLLLQSAAAHWAGELLEWPGFFRLVSMLSCYGVGLPLAVRCMTQVPDVPAPRRSGPYPGEGMLRVFALLGLMYGANLATLAVKTALGRAGDGGTAAAAGPVALAVLQSVVLAPLAEEWLFRGLMLRRLLPLGEREAVAVSALCFALSHGSGEQFLYALAGGLVLGHTALHVGRLRSCVRLHALANAAALFLPRLDPAAETATVLTLIPLGLLAACFLWRRRPLAAGRPAWDGLWRAGGMPLALLYALALIALG